MDIARKYSLYYDQKMDTVLCLPTNRVLACCLPLTTMIFTTEEHAMRYLRRAACNEKFMEKTHPKLASAITKVLSSLSAHTFCLDDAINCDA